MTFDEAKKIFADNFREVGGCNWENDNVFVIGTNSRHVAVKLHKDSENFCISMQPYYVEGASESMTSIKLSDATTEKIAELGTQAAKNCFSILAKEEDSV